MLAGQRLPAGFFTSITWLSEIGVASCRYIEFSTRKSYISNGAYSGRRLKPTPVTVMGRPSAVTVKAPLAGAEKLPLPSTRFHADGVEEPEGTVLMSLSSSKA